MALIRFVRVIVPQLPALVVFAQSQINPETVAPFIPPLLVLLGAIATSADKFLEKINFYGDIKIIYRVVGDGGLSRP